MIPLDQPVISKPRGKHTGAAPLIRKISLEHPEFSEGQIAGLVGCDPANVHRVLDTFRTKFSNIQLSDFQESKADIYDALQLRALMSVTDESLEKASVRDVAVAAGIWEDKARVIRGQATQINVSVLLDAVQAIRDMRKGES